MSDTDLLPAAAQPALGVGAEVDEDYEEISISLTQATWDELVADVPNITAELRGAAAERAAVVAWLRGHGRGSNDVKSLARSIEHGEHLL